MTKFKFALALFMSVLMTHLPATAAQEMISTSTVVEQLSRQEMQAEVGNYLQETEIREALAKQGVSADEISSRLASLSETEMRQLSGQVQQAKAGGDILITVLIVVLIIYLVKRI